jgi:hypothetical protein
MDIPSPLRRLPDHKLTPGLFLPMQEGAWSPSKAPRSTSWTSLAEEQRRLAVNAARYLVREHAQQQRQADFDADTASRRILR